MEGRKLTVEAPQAADSAADAAAEQAAAEAAFGQTRGAEPKPPVEASQPAAPEKSATEIEAENKAQTEARDKAEADEWLKGVPASVRESLSAIQGVQGRLRNVEGHIGGLTSVTKELRAAITAAQTTAASGDAAPTATAIAAAAGDSEKWKAIKDDFPEWADAMDERLAAVRGGSVDVDGITKKVTDGLNPRLSDVKEEARQLARIDFAHDGWEETVKTPEFKEWLESQPEDMQALAGSNKAKDAIKLLDGFKASTSKQESPDTDPAPQDNPRARLEAAVTPTRASQQAQRTAPITEEEAAAAAFKRVRGGS